MDGDEAAAERGRLRSLREDSEQEKLLKDRLSQSFGSFDLLKAGLGNVRDASRPLEWRYSLEAPHYARIADKLMILRPRIVASYAPAFLETKEPRENPVEFLTPLRNTDSIEITIPAGYRAEDVPDPVDLESEAVAYHSRVQVEGRTVRYSRTFEIKKLSVPLAQVDELRKIFRAIRNDENSSVVLARTQG